MDNVISNIQSSFDKISSDKYSTLLEIIGAWENRKTRFELAKRGLYVGPINILALRAYFEFMILADAGSAAWVITDTYFTNTVEGRKEWDRILQYVDTAEDVQFIFNLKCALCKAVGKGC